MLFAHLKRILEDRTARATSSTSQPPPRTSGNSQGSSQCRNRSRHDRQSPHAYARNRKIDPRLGADFFNEIGALRTSNDANLWLKPVNRRKGLLPQDCLSVISL
jgi:hypothetical protein